MGRRRGIPLAPAAALLGLLLPTAVLAQQQRQPQPRLPRRCLPQRKTQPETKLSIDSLQLEGASLPYSVSQAQFVAMLERRAGSGGPGWLDRVWNAAADEWRDRGYARTVVNIHTLADSVQGGVRHVSLRMRVDPGPQYRVAELRILDVNPGGNLVFSSQRLRKMILLFPGDRMDAATLRHGVSAIKRLYASHGYIGLQVTPDLHVDDRQDDIAVYVMLDPGQQYHIGKITVLGFGAEGLSMLKSKIKPGEVFDWNLVRNFYSQYQWLMPNGASVADDMVHRDAETGTVDLLLDFRACPKPVKAALQSQAAKGDPVAASPERRKGLRGPSH